MSEQTLTGWETSTAIALLDLLPGQSYESCLTYVQTYVGNTGGWTPDSDSDPTGQGVPASGQTPAQAAASVSAAQLSAVYETNVAIPLTLQLNFVQKLTSGLNETAVIAAIQDDVVSWLGALIANSDLPISIVANSFGSLTGSLSGTGILTSAERIAIVSIIADGGKLTDYRAEALFFAQNTYGLNSLWNVNTVYVETGTAIQISIALFLDGTFSELDPTATKTYLITVEPDQYQVISGIVLSI